MPAVPFDSLPEGSRVWVFAADRPLAAEAEREVVSAADAFLEGWQAHGAPLTCAREWRDGRFLAIGVDQRSAGASGCSIDGMFRALKSLEPRIGASLTAGGRVFYRDPKGEIRSVTRDEFEAMAESGAVDQTTRVFDTSVGTAGEWRERFETEAGQSWHAMLIA